MYMGLIWVLLGLILVKMYGSYKYEYFLKLLKMPTWDPHMGPIRDYMAKRVDCPHWAHIGPGM